MVINQGCVVALTDCHGPEVTRCHLLRKKGGIRSAQFDLTLTPDIPQLNMFFQVPVIFFYTPGEGFRQECVIHDRESADPQRLHAIGIRRSPITA